MGKKLKHTPNTRIRASLRQLFLRSRERAAVLKEAGYCCCECGVKQSKAKGKEVAVHVHHRSGIDNWAEVMQLIRDKLLNKDDMEVRCKACHDAEHKKEKEDDKDN
jgi:5-methylcytosine-specific restriction endonuclease McrA